MSECGNCLHWRRPEDRGDYTTAVSFQDDEWSDDAEDGLGGYVRGDAEDREYGECRLIPEGWDLPDGPAPLAVVRDGSNYRADLFTKADFGCVLWEEKP